MTEAEVEAVVADPEERRMARPLADNRPAEILISHVDGRQVKVYVEIGRNPTYVKTVFARRRR